MGGEVEQERQTVKRKLVTHTCDQPTERTISSNLDVSHYYFVQLCDKLSLPCPNSCPPPGTIGGMCTFAVRGGAARGLTVTMCRGRIREMASEPGCRLRVPGATGVVEGLVTPS